jgi:hypothetical protein
MRRGDVPVSHHLFPMSLISCIMSEILKYAFRAERETFLRVFELSVGISTNPAIAPNAPQVIMLLEALRITMHFLSVFM